MKSKTSKAKAITKKGGLKAADSLKTNAKKVKKARKVRNKVGLVGFIKNRAARKPMTREEKLWLEIVLGIIAAVYIGFSVFFHFHFLPRTNINGVDVSMDSVEEAKEKMVALTGQYELTVKGVEGTSDETISGKNLNLQFTQFDEVSDSLKRQHELLWPFISWVKKKDKINLNVTYDEQALEEAMDRVGILDPERFKPVEDAYVATDETGHYTIYPEKLGSEIRVDDAKDAIRKAVGKGYDEVELEQYRIYPTIYSDDPGLKHREEQWNEYMKSEGLTYVLWNKDEMIFTCGVLGSLLIDNGQDISLNEEAVEELVLSWHMNYDTYDVPWEFTTHYGDTVTVEPGDYGWRMYVDNTTDSVKSNLYGHDAGRYEVEYYYKGLYDYNQGLGDTYVEVSIGQQMMWIYNGGECVVETPVVTGRATEDRMTHPGCWAVKYKDQSVTLGTYEVNGYESYVNYWICFNGGEGIHDATWRSDFGGDIWIASGSHGCVNTPIEVMPIVYDNVFEDHAVVIYN
ncbi:MAG: L,D-transpeptidase [Lachnospiraceae bacterium]|nr:L,D-transpeptidase [Lachnospiraceae bacterium]